jgi:hypothetical protein
MYRLGSQVRRPTALDRLRCSCRRRGRSVSALLIFAAALSLGCSATSAEPTAEASVIYHYISSTPGLLHSTLKLVPTRQHISAVTTLADGSRLTEEIRADVAGHLLEGEATLLAADSSKSRKLVFDAAHGSLDVIAPGFHRRRQLPRDLPWAWTSLLHDPVTGAPIATPLGAIVVARAASEARALRWLDTEAFETHTVMADQVLVADEGSVTTVLGDDWADLADGIPTQMHLAALQTFLQIDTTQSSSATLASCKGKGRGL